MDWPWEVAERDHELQNPTSAEKVRLAGEYMRLTPESRVLDLACGSAGPARVLAASFGCRILGVEVRPAFVAGARARVAEAGLERLVEAEAAAALAPAVRRGGSVAIGEPFWHEWPLPEGVDDEGYAPLRETVARFERSGLAPTAVVAAAVDDWDRYESRKSG
jgi:SAM-dependent methyltransferase